MKLAELEIVRAALPPGPALKIVEQHIGSIKGKADHAKMMFAHYCTHYGLRPEHLGATFAFRGTTYRIVGLNPSAPRFSVNAVRIRDSKTFRFPARDVLTLLPKAA